ncbi:MAG TPA: glutaredoxin 3 [Steroidobacteraceae bacterium]|nr:glutaredoxin 3 [Steroidobacteraceae bacterium]
MNAPKVLLYVTSWCPYCARARTLLGEKGVAFEEIDVDAIAGARSDMQTRSGRHTVPQIFIGGQHIGGAEDLEALDEAGRLDPLLHNGA